MRKRGKKMLQNKKKDCSLRAEQNKNLSKLKQGIKDSIKI